METAQAANKTRPKKLDDIMEGLAEFIDTCSKLHTFKAGRYGLTYQDAGDIRADVTTVAIATFEQSQADNNRVKTIEMRRAINRHFDNMRIKVDTGERNAKGEKIYKKVPKNSREINIGAFEDSTGKQTMLDSCAHNDFILSERNDQHEINKQLQFRKDVAQRYAEILFNSDKAEAKLSVAPEATQIAQAAINSGIVNTNVIRTEHVQQLLGYASKEGLVARSRKAAAGEVLNSKYELEPKPLITGSTNGHATLYNLHDTLRYRAVLNDSEGVLTESEDNITILDRVSAAFDRQFRNTYFSKDLDLSEAKPLTQEQLDSLSPAQEREYYHQFMRVLKESGDQELYDFCKDMFMAEGFMEVSP